jgi:two-component system response regulator HupR/HoxA
MADEHLPWSELFDLPVVKKTAQILAKRWHMGLGHVGLCDDEERASAGDRPPIATRHARSYNLCQVIQETDAGRRACMDRAQATRARLLELAGARQPKARTFTVTCHAGLCELVAPIVCGGEIIGALLGGPFAAEDKRALEDSLDRRAQELALGSAEYHKAHQRLLAFDERERAFASTLLEAAAEEIAVYLGPAATKKRHIKGNGKSNGDERHDYHGIISRSAPMQALYSVLDRVMRSDATVLIQGENGTGKELVARAIHYGSDRAKRPFIITNCSAFNDNLLDSELFGHRKGAFTGAFMDKPGLFETVDTGTFFLDEVGDMSPSLQVKLLRVLQEGTYTPVGDTETRHVDVRIIAATNRDLKAMVIDGTFREDLYYRINVINLVIPPLRERRDDVQILAEHFLDKHTKRNRRGPKTLVGDCLYYLTQYQWPGNVRELENEIERMIVLAGESSEIDATLLSPRIRGHTPNLEPSPAEEPESCSLPNALRALERRMILDALKKHEWNKTRAAADLDISRRNLIRLVQKYQLQGHAGRS